MGHEVRDHQIRFVPNASPNRDGRPRNGEAEFEIVVGVQVQLAPASAHEHDEVGLGGFRLTNARRQFFRG